MATPEAESIIFCSKLLSSVNSEVLRLTCSSNLIFSAFIVADCAFWTVIFLTSQEYPVVFVPLMTKGDRVTATSIGVSVLQYHRAS